MGRLQSCLPLSLHLQMAQNSTSMSSGQQRMGVPEVWTLEEPVFNVFQVFCEQSLRIISEFYLCLAGLVVK